MSGPSLQPKRKRRTRMAFAALLLAMASPATSSAQGSDPVAARSLFQEGRRLAAEGRYDRACLAFEESQRLDPGIGTLFNWADCLEHQGKTASAWVRYLDVASAAKGAGQLGRERAARERAAGLEANLSRLTVHVQASDPGFELIRDDIAIGKVLWGTSVPIDPGTHVVVARAPGKRPWKATVQIAANRDRVTIVVPALEPEPADASRDPARATSTATPAPPPNARGLARAGDNEQPPTAPTASPGPAPASRVVSDDSALGWRRSQKTLGYVAGGVGVVALITGAVFLVDGISRNNTATAICADRPDACAPDEIAMRNGIAETLRMERTASTVAFVVGGVALAGGGLLLITAPSSVRTSQEDALGRSARLVPVRNGFLRDWRLQASLDDKSASLGVRGTW